MRVTFIVPVGVMLLVLAAFLASIDSSPWRDGTKVKLQQLLFLRGGRRRAPPAQSLSTSSSSELASSAFRPVVGGGLVAATLVACAAAASTFCPPNSTNASGSSLPSTPPYSHPRRAAAAASRAKGGGGEERSSPWGSGLLGAPLTTLHYQQGHHQQQQHYCSPWWLRQQQEQSRGRRASVIMSAFQSSSSSPSAGGASGSSSMRLVSEEEDEEVATAAATEGTSEPQATTAVLGDKGGKEAWTPLPGADEGWQFRSERAPDLQDAFFHPGTTLLLKAGTRHGLSWMAGDVATSVQLSKDRYLWIFGDTFINKDANLTSWDRKGGCHAFPRQTLAEVNMGEAKKENGDDSASPPPPPRQIRFLWKHERHHHHHHHDDEDGDKAQEASSSSSKAKMMHVPGVPLAQQQKEAPAAVSKGGGFGAKVINFFDPTCAVVAAAAATDKSVTAAATEDKTSSSEEGSKGEGEEEEGAWYWVVSGVRPGLQGPLVLLASLVVRTNANALGFETKGTGAIRVNNPDDDPQDWEYDQVRVPGTTETLNWFPGVTLYHDSDDDDDGSRNKERGGGQQFPPWALLVGVEGVGLGVRQVMGRVPVDDLLALDFTRMQVWAKEGVQAAPQWMALQRYLDEQQSSSSSSATSRVDLVSVLEHGILGVTELSLLHDQRLDMWLMVTLPAFGNKVWLWTAPEPTGPWSRSLALDINAAEKDDDEKEDSNKKPPQRLFYASKLHPELSGPDDLVGTYCANVLGDWPRPKDYTPRFFRMHFKRRRTYTTTTADSSSGRQST